MAPGPAIKVNSVVARNEWRKVGFSENGVGLPPTPLFQFSKQGCCELWLSRHVGASHRTVIEKALVKWEWFRKPEFGPQAADSVPKREQFRCRAYKGQQMIVSSEQPPAPRCTVSQCRRQFLDELRFKLYEANFRLVLPRRSTHGKAAVFSIFCSADVKWAFRPFAADLGGQDDTPETMRAIQGRVYTSTGSCSRSFPW